MVVPNLFAQPIGAPTPAPAAQTPFRPAAAPSPRFDGALQRAAASPDRSDGAAQNASSPAHQSRPSAQDNGAKAASDSAEPDAQTTTDHDAPSNNVPTSTDATRPQGSEPTPPEQSDSHPHTPIEPPSSEGEIVAEVVVLQHVVPASATTELAGATNNAAQNNTREQSLRHPAQQSAPSSDDDAKHARSQAIGAQPKTELTHATPRLGAQETQPADDSAHGALRARDAKAAANAETETHASARADREVRGAEQRTLTPDRAQRPPEVAANPHAAERALESRPESVRLSSTALDAGLHAVPTDQGHNASGDQDDRSSDPDARRRAAERTLDRASSADHAEARQVMRAATQPAPAQPQEPGQPQQISATIADRAQSNAQGLYGPAQAKPSLAQPNQQENAQQAFEASVSRGLGAAVRQRGGTITVQLQPEALGSLRIRMDIDRGVVTARFDASTAQARDLLTRNMEMLRTSLEARGLSVDKLQVTLASSGSGQGSQAGQQHASGDQGRPSHHDAGDGQSRGAFDRRQDADGGRDGGREGKHGRERAEPFETMMNSREQRVERVRLAVDAVA